MKKSLLLFVLILSTLMVHAQALNAFLLQYHAAGCDNQSGKLAVVPTGGTGNYTYLWSNGSTVDTAYNLSAGIQTVTVYSGTDSIIKSVTLDPFGIESVNVTNACNGGLGSIYLNNINAQYPLQFHWYNSLGMLTETTASLGNLTAGNYYYSVIDADGCIDSGNVDISASSPVLFAYVSDTALCYGQSAQVWYTPGFTLYDNWGIAYNSTTDTLVAYNYMNGISYPTAGVDSFGCEAYLSTNPFVYLQPHPDPVPLFQVGDTISTGFSVNLNPVPDIVYTWSCNGTQVSSGPYSYVQIDSTGFYTLSITNQYGCSNFGSIQAVITGSGKTEILSNFSVTPNPAGIGQQWKIVVTSFSEPIPFALYNSAGKLIVKSSVTSANCTIETPEIPGIYFIEISNRRYKLICN